AITSAPGTAQTGQTITVSTGAPVSSFALIRYGEATHTVDNDQRRIPLQILSSSANTYSLAIPADPGVALPGPYMLFATGANGTPSLARTIRVNPPAPATPNNPYGQRVYADGPALYWPLSDPAGASGAADLSVNRDTATFTPTGITYQTSSPVEGSTGQGLTLSAGRVTSTQPKQTPTTYSEEVWFQTTTTRGGILATYAGSDGSQDR